MNASRNLALLAGRILIAALFIYDAYLMVTGWDGTVAYMEKFGLPGALLPLVAGCQFIGGVAIVLGFQTRLAALAFAVYCLSTALVFHHDLGNGGETIQAGKDLAIAGGFLFLAATGAGAWSLDRRGRP
jgi:putative oxidoreductase